MTEGGAEGSARGWLDRAGLVALVAAWCLALLWTWLETEAGSRESVARAIVSLVGLGLAVLAVRDAWSGPWTTWGWAVLGVQGGGALLWALLQGAGWGWWLAGLALVVGLVTGGAERGLPETTGRRFVLAAALFVMVSPLADATLLGPSLDRHPSMEPGTPYEAGARETWSAGVGEVHVQRTSLTSEELPDVDLVTVALPADEDRLRILDRAFRDGSTASFTFTLPFPPFPTYEQREVAERTELADGWEAFAIGHEKRDTMMGVAGTAQGERQNFLLLPVGETTSVRTFPPGTAAWDVLAGYRFHEDGNTSRALDVLANHTTLDGQPLQPPAEAEEHVRWSGEYSYPIPGPGALVAVAMLATIAVGRERRPIP